MRCFSKTKVDKLSAYKLQLKGMPVGTQQFHIVADSDFFTEMESEEIRGGNVDVAITVTKKAESYDLAIHCNGVITIGCDRCLDDMEHTVDADYNIVVKYGDSYNDDNDELLIIPESENQLDVASMVYDTIALTIPLMHVHPEGKCNKEMAEKLKQHSAQIVEEGEKDYEDSDDEETETEQNGNYDPRWKALRDLLDNK